MIDSKSIHISKDDPISFLFMAELSNNRYSAMSWMISLLDFGSNAPREAVSQQESIPHVYELKKIHPLIHFFKLVILSDKSRDLSKDCTVEGKQKENINNKMWSAWIAFTYTPASLAVYSFLLPQNLEKSMATHFSILVWRIP